VEFIIYRRENCTDDFVEKLKGFTNRGHNLLNVSIGCDGDWFTRTDQSLCKCRLTFKNDTLYVIVVS